MTALQAEQVTVELPVRLSEQARAQALRATGARPHASQLVVVEDLAEVTGRRRERLVDLIERVDFDPGDHGIHFGPPPDAAPPGVRVKAYEWLRRGIDGWTVWSDQSDDDGGAVDLDQLYVASPGRTLRLAEHFEQLVGAEQLHALLDGEPLVAELPDNAELTVDVALDAYEAALGVARQIVSAARQAPRPDDDHLWISGIGWGDGLVLFRLGREDLTPFGLLRESDPETFAKALAVAQEMDKAPIPVAEEFVGRVSRTAENLRRHRLALDAQIYQHAIEPAAEAARQHLADQAAAAERQQRYDDDRAAWIAEHGSRRLQLAAERGYRHDGLYRDERLAAELPGFVGSLGRRPEIKDVINPTEAALECEGEALAHAEQLRPAVKVRLVWAKPSDEDLDDGEYVEVENYLGRFMVYRPVSGPGPDI